VPRILLKNIRLSFSRCHKYIALEKSRFDNGSPFSSSLLELRRLVVDPFRRPSSHVPASCDASDRHPKNIFAATALRELQKARSIGGQQLLT